MTNLCCNFSIRSASDTSIALVVDVVTVCYQMTAAAGTGPRRVQSGRLSGRGESPRNNARLISASNCIYWASSLLKQKSNSCLLSGC